MVIWVNLRDFFFLLRTLFLGQFEVPNNFEGRVQRSLIYCTLFSIAATFPIINIPTRWHSMHLWQRMGLHWPIIIFQSAQLMLRVTLGIGLSLGLENWMCMWALNRVRLFAIPQTSDHSPPDSSVHGIFQARILEWVAIFFSRVSSWPRDQTCIFASPALAGRFLTTEPPGMCQMDNGTYLPSQHSTT